MAPPYRTRKNLKRGSPAAKQARQQLNNSRKWVETHRARERHINFGHINFWKPGQPWDNPPVNQREKFLFPVFRGEHISCLARLTLGQPVVCPRAIWTLTRAKSLCLCAFFSAGTQIHSWKIVVRRRTNVQQLTCNIDLSNYFYYLFFSFVLMELKPFVLKGKVLGEKFWKSAKKCENYETILPFSCCPLVFPWHFDPGAERAREPLFRLFSESSGERPFCPL